MCKEFINLNDGTYRRIHKNDNNHWREFYWSLKRDGIPIEYIPCDNPNCDTGEHIYYMVSKYEEPSSGRQHIREFAIDCIISLVKIVWSSIGK